MTRKNDHQTRSATWQLMHSGQHLRGQYRVVGQNTVIVGVGSGIVLGVNPPLYDVVLVRDVIAGSPAAHAGVQPGDRIMRIRLGGGKFLGATSLTQVNKALAKPEERLTLYLRRGGKPIKISLQSQSLI